ncbi:MAG: asparagine synthase (glutamine-hydrolyzing) [Calditrichaeota bacterium]|nr:asparagine synthase (glutamine-hydrolyzing) [Calditrichota bacterium]MCB9366013.1 asparagine synthase (glutamine-hydrolyzing) [Calditrichota bacterium]MCB9391861.1 asparagine synthase (glutamine-hydrolyzing) [Calditrichota bacterium]
MCGSVAIIAEGTDVTPVLSEALDLIASRGPDSRQVASTSTGGAAHCRLALRGSDGGSQPVLLNDGGLLTFVGEIYNDAELRSLLTLSNRQFHSSGDTEVLAAAVECWKERSWRMMNGMFAVSQLANDRAELTLVRDEFGVKPLFFTRAAGGAAAASECSALRKLAASESASAQGVVHFLRTSQVSNGTRTVWKDIETVSPGTQVTLTRSHAELANWLEPRVPDTMVVDPLLAANKLRYLLSEAVYRQLQADFPVGVFLSGGLDSSLLAAFAAQHQTTPLDTFAVALEGDEEDLIAAKNVAEHLGTRHRSKVVSPREFFQAMEQLVAKRALPVSLPNEVLIYLLSSDAAKSVKAVLCGEGADEQFGGYHRLLARLAQRSAHDTSITESYRAATAWFERDALQDALRDPALVDQSERQDLAQLEMTLEDRSFGDEARTLLMYDHYPHLLLRLDGAAMAASLEGRVPFADRDVVNFARSLDTSLLAPAFGLEKPILRKSGQGLLPEAILKRPKRAFSASLDTLFSSHEGQELLKRVLKQSLIVKLFHQEKLECLVNDDFRTRIFQRTWLICSLGLWSDVCGVSEIN